MSENTNVNKTMNVIKAKFVCYIDRAPVVLAAPGPKYILRDKKTNKEIVPWKLVKYHGNQKADVCKDPIEQLKFHEFLTKAAEHEQVGKYLQDRDETKFGVMVVGVFLNENDECINLMNPVFSA